MKKLSDIFGKKKKQVEDVVVVEQTDVVCTQCNGDVSKPDSMDDMKKVAQTIDSIKRQNAIQALLSGSKNERALAENDALISNVIKNILNWLAIITSAETVRKEEYDVLTTQMLQLDEDINTQLEMQVKFKKAYQTMIQKQEEQKELYGKIEKMRKTNMFLKFVSLAALGLACVAIILAFVI